MTKSWNEDKRIDEEIVNRICKERRILMAQRGNVLVLP